MLVFGGVHVSYFVGIWIKPVTLPEANEMRFALWGWFRWVSILGFGLLLGDMLVLGRVGTLEVLGTTFWGEFVVGRMALFEVRHVGRICSLRGPQTPFEVIWKLPSLNPPSTAQFNAMHSRFRTLATILRALDQIWLLSPDPVTLSIECTCHNNHN